MKSILIIFLVAGNATGGWYFSSGRVALGLGIVVASWVIFTVINGLVPQSEPTDNEADSDLPDLATEVPLDQVFSPPKASTHHSTSFPDITDEDAATADPQPHLSQKRASASAIASEEETSAQKCLF